MTPARSPPALVDGRYPDPDVVVAAHRQRGIQRQANPHLLPVRHLHDGGRCLQTCDNRAGIVRTPASATS
jgi:hypothetical protein